MAQQDITIGVANQGDGDTLFTAFTAVENNFDDLYSDDTNDINSVAGTAPIASAEVAGDVTISLNDLGVTTAKLANDSVTFDKLGVEYTASTALTSASAIAVDTALSDVFTFTAGHSATLNFTNVGIGDLKSFVITGGGGSYTLAFGTSNGSSATYNKISGTFLDTASAKNLVQIKFVAVNEAWYSISQIAS